MTDAECRQVKRRIQRLLDKWLHPLGLKWWQIDVTWDRANSCEHDPPGGKEHCAAHVNARWEYLSADIAFHLPQLVELPDDKLEQTVVHDLCHVLVNQMRPPRAPNDETADEWMEHEERVVTTLALAFIWTYEEAERIARKQSMAKGPIKKRRTS